MSIIWILLLVSQSFFLDHEETYDKIQEERRRLIRSKEKIRKKLSNILGPNTVSSKDLDQTTMKMSKSLDAETMLSKINQRQEKMIKAEAV
jgi:hypothetical protein